MDKESYMKIEYGVLYILGVLQVLEKKKVYVLKGQWRDCQ